MRPGAVRVIAKGVQHGASPVMLTVAGINDPGKLALEALQSCNPFAQADLLAARDLMDVLQCSAAGALKRDQRRDVRQRQAQVTRVPDKAKPDRKSVV